MNTIEMTYERNTEARYEAGADYRGEDYVKSDEWSYKKL